MAVKAAGDDDPEPISSLLDAVPRLHGIPPLTPCSGACGFMPMYCSSARPNNSESVSPSSSALFIAASFKESEIRAATTVVLRPLAMQEL